MTIEGSMDPFLLMLIILTTLMIVATVLITLGEAVIKLTRTLIVSIARVKVEKYRAMGRTNGVQGE